ncbi:hypothetical protein F0562_027333 [Nyssa sinensis]|uniref:Protein kinase domain-containing protein n=1 Tax=Nyssa sinensis TaxID=561372 RepID=A0A5J5B7C6_9ASTE|nr:hypothetical protein F0562_027333 [Nyssa sinensis]
MATASIAKTKWFSNKTLKLSLPRHHSKSKLPSPPPSILAPKNSTKQDKFREVFCYFDSDRDGKISAEEIGAYFASTGDFISHDEAQRVIREFDMDGDNLLEFQEFVQLMGRDNEIEGDDDLRRAFKMFEVDKGSECITPKGLQQVLNRLGDAKSYEECVAMIRVFDLDGNGVLDFHDFLTSCIESQQEYSANSVLDCNNNNDETKPSPSFLYTCNGQNSSCRAFLIFKSQPPYDSVPAISALTSSNPSELARINNVTGFTVFPTGKEVIIPVNCSCSGQYYQANTTFYIPTIYETYFIIANNTYQGLSTCDTLMHANPYSEFSLEPGLPLQVPLRCACPTRNQIAEGTKYLVTYSVSWKDNLSYIGKRFNTSEKSILDANGFSKENPTLFPFTTILIALPTEPLSSQTIIHNPKLEVSPPPVSKIRKNGSKGKLYMCVGIAAGCSLLLFSVIILTIFLFYKKRTEGFLQSDGEETKSVLPKDLLAKIASFDQVLKVFKFEEIKKATENFSSKSRIKGSVYRGVFSREVLAVKRTSLDVSQQVKMLNKINHFNLIKLHGVCEHNSSFYLVFEYMKNGSLREWLQKKSSNETESWTRRIQIALDVANGLHYLHNFTKPIYVHKDIKSSNVLLDSNLRAKIANFSHARTTAKGTKIHVLTTRVVGTRGYMAPEYIESGLVSPKIDVYAFGVVMLELITGKDAVVLQDGQEVLLSAAITSIMEGENAETKLGCLIDPGLEENGGMEYALQIAKLSLTCLKQDPASRPSMGEREKFSITQRENDVSEFCSFPSNLATVTELVSTIHIQQTRF